MAIRPAFLLALLALPAPLRAQVTAIRAGQMIDVEAGTTLRNQVILIEKGKITAVGAALTVPAGAQVIDLSGSTVMPGIFDMHTHLCLSVLARRDAGNYFYTTLNDPDAMRAVEGVVNARDMLNAGFTTVRDVGNEGNYACVSVARAITRGWIPGPTMLTAGRMIAPYGGQFHLQPGRRELAEPEYFIADTHDEMVKAVRENAYYGATLIKIIVDDQRYIYSADDIRFIVAEAKRAGLRVAAHSYTHEGGRNAAEAGVASIEHGIGMTDEDLELAKKNGVTLVGTEFPAAFDSVEHPLYVDRLRRAYRIGVTMAFGTDASDYVPGMTRGQEALKWIGSWKEAGVPAKVLLRAMTVNAARLAGLENERGAIRPGLAADLIAMPRNPLDDPEALEGVTFVMKDGKLVRGRLAN